MAEKYCECGCGQLAPISTRNRPKQGHVLGEPMRFVKNHDKRVAPAYRVDEKTGCWVWSNGRTKGGYSRIRREDGGQDYAHRVFYEQHVGPIPEGLEIDHLCRNRACVNPAHLEAVSGRENTRRGKGVTLTPGAVRYIRNSRELARDLADRFGVSKTYIYQLRGNYRKDIWIDERP